MSRAQFSLAYDGPALRAGLMDVNELAPALLSVGDLLRAINKELNGDAAQVSVRVKADFQRGSFDIALLLDQSLIEHAKTLFTGAELADAKKILELAFGTGVAAGAVGMANSLLDLWKKLRGEKPRNTVRDDSRGITVIQIGDGNQVNVDPTRAELYNNDVIRNSISGTTRPVSRSGIKSLEIRKGKKVVDTVTKDDLPALDQRSGALTTTNQPGLKRLEDTREAMLRVTRANFEKGKWGFSDGTASFSADIADEEFKQKLDAREIGFFKGDILRVRLLSTQTISTDGTFETRYVIERVLDHIHPAIQQEMSVIREVSRRGQKRLPPSPE